MTLVGFLLCLVMLAYLCELNATIDSLKILSGKSINHNANGLYYAACVGILFVLCYTETRPEHFWHIVYEWCLFDLSASLVRQIVFDTRLNVKRSLKWDYVSPERKSITDKIEFFFFGYNGKPAFIFYCITLLFCFTIKILL
jgi:hypothetical protein